MNAAYIAIGCAFIAIGATSVARGRKADDELKAKNARIAGALMILAGAVKRSSLSPRLADRCTAATGAIAGGAA